MLRIAELDHKVPVREQIAAAEPGPVVVINTFAVEAGDSDKFLEAWAANAAFFKRQPGFISTQLYQGIAGSRMFISEALWECLEKFRTAFASPDAQKALALFPDGVTVTPHLLRRIAVPDICLA
jgi:heme-degrading monooxygenase HmoA